MQWSSWEAEDAWRGRARAKNSPRGMPVEEDPPSSIPSTYDVIKEIVYSWGQSLHR